MTPGPLSVVCVNFERPARLIDPDAVPALYPTLADWSEALVQTGARVTVVQRFERRAQGMRNGVTYVCSRPADLHQAVQAATPDVVHVNGLIFPLHTWRLRRALSREVALVVQDHGNHREGRGARFSPRRMLLRLGTGAADALLFSSIAQVDGWRHAGVVRDEACVRAVLEASTRTRPVPRAAACDATGIAGQPALLWVGRLNANKDPLTVLDGFERALAHLPAATLTMVFGDDELLPAVESRVRASAALHEHVRLVGGVPPLLMPGFYSAADLFVSGSHHEGSGYALLEACACGTIPVVTDIPPFRAITGDGEIGQLWRVGDPGACARAIMAAARRCDAAERAVVIGRFERALSWPVVAQRALAIYHEAAQARRRGARVRG